MEPKFKAGDAVKLRDDVEYGKKYNGVSLEDYRAKKDTKYTIYTPLKDHSENAYYLMETNAPVGEDALEAWPESTEETRSNEIDPQLLELAKAIAPTICLIHMNEQKRYDATVTPNGIATDTVAIAKETLRLLREEKL